MKVYFILNSLQSLNFLIYFFFCIFTDTENTHNDRDLDSHGCSRSDVYRRSSSLPIYKMA